MKVDIIIITYNRSIELEQTLKNILTYENELNNIIIINNNSPDNTTEILTKYKNKKCIKIFNLKKNLGVAGGRNYAIQKSDADVMVFIDDDAIFISENPIKIIKEYFYKEKQLGVLAFKIVNYYTKKIRYEEFPATDKNIDSDQEFLTSYYIGAGHAIRREVFELCGLYPDEFFYGHEELDLSFRVINTGFYIKYTPKVCILHKCSPKGRLNDKKKWKILLRNRLLIHYKYLPWKYRIVSDFLWTLKTLVVTRSPKVIYKSWKEFQFLKKKQNKWKLNQNALKYLKENHGRLFY